MILRISLSLKEARATVYQAAHIMVDGCGEPTISKEFAICGWYVL